MATQIFVNLPIKSLDKSVAFFTKLGFKFNPQFTDETATCMIVSDDIFVMLLTEAKFKSFTLKEICDAKKYTEVLVCLSSESQEKVDEMVRNAVAAGGTTPRQVLANDRVIPLRSGSAGYGLPRIWRRKRSGENPTF